MTTPLAEAEIYKRLSDDFRALNAILWQLPPIMITITGGLWFAAATFKVSPSAQSGILLFAAVANALMIAAMFRLRIVILGLQEQIRDYDKLPLSKSPFTTVTLMSVMLGLSAIGSLWVAACPTHYFKSEELTSAISLEVKH